MKRVIGSLVGSIALVSGVLASAPAAAAGEVVTTVTYTSTGNPVAVAVGDTLTVEFTISGITSISQQAQNSAWFRCDYPSSPLGATAGVTTDPCYTLINFYAVDSVTSTASSVTVTMSYTVQQEDVGKVLVPLVFFANDSDKAWPGQIPVQQPVSLTLQGPSGVQVSAGGTATFSTQVTAPPVTGLTSQVTYAWESSTDSGVNWSAIPGASSSSYTTPQLALQDDGTEYRVTATRNAFALGLNTTTGPPTSTTQYPMTPVNQSGSATVTVLPPAPNITNVSPSTGVSSGDTIAVTGTDLDTATVTVGGQSVTPTTNTSSSITFAAPSLALGPQTVSVSTLGGLDTATINYGPKNLLAQSGVSIAWAEEFVGALNPPLGLETWPDMIYNGSDYANEPAGQTYLAQDINANTSVIQACNESWLWVQILCDPSPQVNSLHYVVKQDTDAGFTIDSESETDAYVVIDLGQTQTFNTLRVFQMFSDGKVTQASLYTHPETGNTRPAFDDAGWSLAGQKPVGSGLETTLGADDVVACPTVLSLGSRTSRYVQMRFKNSGEFGSPSWIEVGGAKLFNESGSEPVSPASCAPEPPVDPTATSGNESAQLSWTPGEGTATGWGIQQSDDGGLNWSNAVTEPAALDGSATSSKITGLTNGTPYVFRVRALNSTLGIDSPYTPPSNAVTPSNTPDPSPDPTPPPLPSKPSAPGAVKLDPGPARIGVSWSAATAPSDAPVLFYRATATPGGQSCQTSAPITSCMITGLTNGTAYSVAVTALNAGGSGPAATAGPVTPTSDAPARPGRPTVKAGNAQVTVTVQPGSGGGEAGSYTATASPGGQSCTVTAPGLTCVITGLTNGTDYTVSVVATNGAGSSDASPASESVTPNGDLPEAPATPGRPAAVAGDSSATVTVRAGSGGGEAEQFIVTASPGGATCTITAPDTSCELTGLTNGTGYTFSAVATNAGGSSESSEPSAPVTPQVEAPGPPASVRVLVGDGQATIFATPSDEGGPTDRFVVISSPGTKACVITLPATSCVITGLTNGTAYTFAVSASNDGGSTRAPSPTAPVTPEPAIDPEPVPLVDPPAPGQGQATEDGKQVDLEVTPDPAGTGLTVTTPTFTLGVEGVDRRGNPVGLQNDQVLLLVDDGRTQTQGTGFRPGSQARVFLGVNVIGNGSMLRADADSVIDLGALRVDSVGDFAGTVNLPADLAPGDYVLQVTGVTQNNGERAVSLGVRVVDNNATITLIKGNRTKVKGRVDRVRSTGTSEGVLAGTKLVPYYRFANSGSFTRGKATIIVKDDGTFTWSRKVNRNKILVAYVTFASAESNTVKWRKIR